MKGMLSIDQLRAEVGAGSIDTVVVAFTDHYGRVNGKRFDAEFFLDEVSEHGTHGCDYLLTTDMEMEPVAGYEYANWDLGYGDFHMVPDLSTLRVASWLDRTALVLCDLHGPIDHEPVPVAPRSMLKRQLHAASEAGFAANGASELEYFLFENSYREAAEIGYAGMRPLGWYIEDYHILQGTREEFYNAEVRRHLSRSGIPVESSKGEWGRGQHEMNIRYAGLLEMADRHTVMKLAMKEIADRLGMSVTFMAKPDVAEAGSSCHLHVSLWREGSPAFPGETPYGPVATSAEFQQFLGGWVARTPELMPFFAPTINSYKRFQDGSWAPTRLAVSYDNRTAGFRVVGADQSLRIECRMPGADVNPYLAYTAVLAAGLDGIARQAVAPALFEGDAYRSDATAHIPKTLRDATDLFEASEFVREALGEMVQRHYAHFFREEQRAFDNTVTDWERHRYFERI